MNEISCLTARMAKSLAAVIVTAGLAGTSPALARSIYDSPAPGVAPLNVHNAVGRPAHIMPTPTMAAARHAALQPARPTPLAYHGGPIMTPNVTIYAIFWQPAATTMAVNYKSVLTSMITNYAGHAIANINTQYYQTVSTVTTYVSGAGALGGVYTDTDPFPASGCATYAQTGVTPIACLTDAQIMAEVTKVLPIVKTGKAAWTPAINKIFMVFTPQGVESCFSSTGAQCAYKYYCAYHSSFGAAATPTIYANEPYGEPTLCNTITPAALPNGNGGYADTAATAARHEISEATTDPKGNAWYDSTTFDESSDKCAYQYGLASWDKVGFAYLANYMWGGTFLMLQEEWSQHTNDNIGGCVQQGP